VKLLTQGEVEQAIHDLSQELESTTYAYAELSDAAAEAEADYKLRQARVTVALADSNTKMTAQERQARAELTAAEELRRWKLAEARRQACKEALLTLRARLDAMRSLSANLRHQT
jgi:hypothetical protein